MSKQLLEEQLIIKYKNLHLSKAKLKQTSHTSALLSGFAMVALVEVQLNHTGPEWLLILFAVVTSLLVSVHLIAVMISTCILPHIEAIAQMDSRSIDDSPHERLKYYIELAWACSTTVGLILFLIDIAIIVWVKFLEYSWWASFSATMLMVPILIIFVAFAWHFYWSLGTHSYVVTSRKLLALEDYMREIQDGQFISGSAASLQMAGPDGTTVLRDRRFGGSSIKKYPPRVSEGDIEAGLLWAAGDAVRRNQMLYESRRDETFNINENTMRSNSRLADTPHYVLPADRRYLPQSPGPNTPLNPGEIMDSRVSPTLNSSWHAVNERWQRKRSLNTHETPPSTVDQASSVSRHAPSGAKSQSDNLHAVGPADNAEVSGFNG